MERDGKIRQLAELIVQKHRGEALAIIIERIQGRLLVQDFELVAMWALVAQAVLPHATQHRYTRSRVQEIVAGIVTTVRSTRAVSRRSSEREATYLRERAARLRDIVTQAKPSVAGQLMEVAADLERSAAELK